MFEFLLVTAPILIVGVSAILAAVILFIVETIVIALAEHLSK